MAEVRLRQERHRQEDHRHGQIRSGARQQWVGKGRRLSWELIFKLRGHRPTIERLFQTLKLSRSGEV